jgi:hypothetical protein
MATPKVMTYDSASVAALAGPEHTFKISAQICEGGAPTS